MRVLSHLSFLFVFTLSVSLSAQKIYEGKSEKKIRKTISCKVSDSVSIHFSVSFQSKTMKYKYNVILAGSSAKKLNSFLLEKNYNNIISSHFSHNKFVFITEYKKHVFIHEYDLTTEKLNAPKELINFSYDIIIPKDDRSLLINRKNNVLTVFNIETIGINSKNVYTPEKETNLNGFKLKTNFDYVTTDEYIEIGSIKKGHIYLYKDTLLFSYDNSHSKKSIVLTLDIRKSGKYTTKIFQNNLDHNRQVRSFITPEYLFQFAINRTDARLSLFDFTTTKLLKEFTYTKTDFGPYNKYFYYKKEVPVNPKKFFRSFAKFKVMTSYLATIFITVNKGVNDTYIVESGHIDGNVYGYYNDYNHTWMMQQMMIQPPKVYIPNFGPNAINDEFILNNTTDEIQKTSFILAIDNNFLKLDSIPNSVLTKDKWKEEYIKIEKLSDQTRYKAFSTVALKNSLRYMYQNKKLKALYIGEIKKKK